MDRALFVVLSEWRWRESNRGRPKAGEVIEGVPQSLLAVRANTPR
jgi:hypothetical protein